MSSGNQQGRQLSPGGDHIRIRRAKRGEEFQKLQPCHIVIPATLDPDGLQKLGHRLGIRADGIERQRIFLSRGQIIRVGLDGREPTGSGSGEAA